VHDKQVELGWWGIAMLDIISVPAGTLHLFLWRQLPTTAIAHPQLYT
jgi:hypothetical protein